jgi:hypothetical protein
LCNPPSRAAAESYELIWLQESALPAAGVQIDEPQLAEVLKHSHAIVLAEPGGGKSVVARAAVREPVAERKRVPVFSELKEIAET